MIERRSMLTAERVLEVIGERASAASGDLLVYWLKVDGSRHSYANELHRLRGARLIVPLVPKDGFINPNALLSDLSKLCVENRDKFSATLQEGLPPLSIIIISSADLGVAQVSSPATLPEWMPFCGGRSVWVQIESLNRVATGNLNAPELSLQRITEALYQTEGAMVRRLRAVSSLDHNTASALLDRLRRRDERLALADFLAGCEAHLASVAVPSGYRPSLRADGSLLSRLVALFARSSPDELGGAARALATALALERADIDRASILSVLFRATNRATGPERSARALLVALYAAYQLTTAGAHAAEYPAFPLELLSALSRDLHVALTDAAYALELPLPA
jgi:hypothetical protein